MNLRKILFIFLCPFVPLSLSSSLHATETDPFDYVLVAYELSKEQEAQFSINDTGVSKFWARWEQGALDRVTLVPDMHGGPELSEGFTGGAEDAQVELRAAWGERGLYLLWNVTDDDFVDVVFNSGMTGMWGSDGDQNAERGNDAVMLTLAHESTEELVANEDQYFMLNNGNPLSYAFYFYRFGGDLPDPEFEINRFNPSWDWDQEDSVANYTEQVLRQWHRWDVPSMTEEIGIHLQVLPGATSRSQEWLLEWRQIGQENGFTKPSSGAKIACSFGYGDADQGMVGNDQLTWRGINTWSSRPASLEAWGDLEFGPGLDIGSTSPSGADTASSSAGATALRRPGIRRESGRAAMRLGAAPQYFGLAGRRIAAESAAGGILIRRKAHGARGSRCISAGRSSKKHGRGTDNRIR